MLPFYENKTQILQAEGTSKMSFPPHLHISLELLYVQRGRVKTIIDDKEYILTDGDIIFIFPNTVHSYEPVEGFDDCECIMAIYNTALSKKYEGTVNTTHPLNPLLKKQYVHPDIPYVMKALLEESRGEQNDRVITAFMSVLLERALPYLSLVPNKDILRPEIVASIIEYLAKSFTEPLDLESVAEVFGISRYRLSRIFANRIGISFSKYINTLRISSAQSLLINSDAHILNIALECGFENQQTFNRVFKEISGISPREYRKKYAVS